MKFVSSDILDIYEIDENNNENDKSLKDLFELKQNPKGYKKIFSHLLFNLQDQFFEIYWEKKPVLFKRNQNADLSKLYNEILSKQKLLDIFKTNRLQTEYNLKACQYLFKQRVNVEINDFITEKDLKKLFSNNSTLQFFQPQRFSDMLYVINAGFEYVFGSLAGASAYFTPPNSQGLAPHYDDIEAFIIQTEGSKTWKLWKSEFKLPEVHSEDIAREKLIGQPETFTLYPGDLLYIPRGTIHEAIAQSDFSTHVTVSLYQKYHVKSLLQETVTNKLDEAFNNNISLRYGLPLRLPEKLGTYVNSRINNQINFSSTSNICNTVDIESFRENYFKEMKLVLHNLVDNIKLDDFDKAADNILDDFVLNRLPTPDVGNSFEISFDYDLTILICDPQTISISIKEIENSKMIFLANCRNNERLKHMGHPVDMDDLSSNDEDSNDCNLEKFWNLQLPYNYLPIVSILCSSYNNGGMSYRNIECAIKSLNLTLDDIKQVVSKLNEQGYIEKVYNIENKNNIETNDSKKKRRIK